MSTTTLAESPILTSKNGVLWTVILLSVCSFAWPEEALATVLGVYGRTYAFAERDGMEELMERVREANWEALLDRDQLKEEVLSYKPKGIRAIPKATMDKTYYVDPSRAMPFDLVDHHGQIIYAKGTSVNPLDFTQLSSTLVVLNPTDEEQVEWFKKSEHYDLLTTRVLISGGRWKDVQKELRMRVFYADPKIVSALRIQRVPCVIRQAGKSWKCMKSGYRPPGGIIAALRGENRHVCAKSKRVHERGNCAESICFRCSPCDTQYPQLDHVCACTVRGRGKHVQ